ncbi:MAG TPA: M1 family aminopeptidase, partial [Bacteroidota bacterium]|nr:M1 family aminopeptidase [Bacteroidota bacterium]
VEFEEKVPEDGGRSGHQGRDYNMAQWYPQIATYDKYGWDKSQYLGPAEFHNEFGAFDVNITLPKSFSIGYSGTLLNPEEVYPDSVLQRLKESEGNIATVRIADYSNVTRNDSDSVLVTWKFRAENVRDFAWSANENYIWDITHWSPNIGEPSVAIHSLYFSDKAEFWKDVAQYGQHAVSFFSQHFGQYQYPNVFIVEGVVGGGMEYPGITFIGHYGDKNTHGLFGVVTHEVAHNWYPMMVGTNEIRYAFMDEGFATFMTMMAMEHYYGRYDNEYEWTEWFPKFLRYSNDHVREGTQRNALWLAKNHREEPIATHSYRFSEPGLAGTSIYSKTATVLLMLQYVLGDSVFEVAMKEYFNRWQFKHPYPEDFYSAMQVVGGKGDLSWFFDQWFNRTYRCDYGMRGLHYQVQQKENNQIYRTTLHIKRYEEAIMPLDIRVVYSDGSDTTLWLPVDRWMNAETEQVLEADLPRQPVRAEINPDGRILDINRLNNSSSIPKMTIKLDNTLQSVTPIDAYFVKWRPSLWYTDQGGWKFGYRINGSYLNDLHSLRLFQWYNTRDNTLNYDISTYHNTYKLTPMSSRSVRYFRIEGRKGWDVSFQKSFRKYFSYPPEHTTRLTYSFLTSDNVDYLLVPLTWQEGNLHRVILGYDYYNRGKLWNVNASFNLETSTSILGRSDFLYTKRTFQFKLNYTMPRQSTLALRYYLGAGYGDIPIQSKYYFSGASPIEQLNAPFYRSKGPLPSTIRDHAILPGGGNMRGYYNSFAVGDKMDALNLELRYSTMFPFFNFNLPVVNRITDMFRSVIFFDAGRIASDPQKLLDQRYEIDFGFGFRLKSLSTLFGPFSQSNILSSVGLQTLRIDFPIYVSMPIPDENKLKFRWVVSLSEAF